MPVGVSLSGGLDSSTITTCINYINADKKIPVHTFSARFFDNSKDEGRYIDYVVKKTGVVNHQIWVDEKNVENDFVDMMYYQEEPFGGLSPLAQYQVMKLAKEKNVTVLIDGQGADEVLAGYTHFFNPYYKELLNNSTVLKREKSAYRKLYGEKYNSDLRFQMEARYPRLLRVLGNLKRKLVSPLYLNFLNKDFANPYKMSPPPFKNFNNLNESLEYYTNIFGLEKLLKLADKNAMAHSREVRLPFLFHELVEFLFELPAEYKINDGWTKYIMRRAFEDIMPSEITWRTNKFGYQPPQEKWVNIPKVEEMLAEARTYLFKEGILKNTNQVPERDWHILELYTLMKMKFS